jgi:8-oxo-dGTP diphosphatase
MCRAELEDLQRQAEAEGKICVVGALIQDAQGRIFVQKRSAQRKLFPNCWDIVGGHVEGGETLLGALEREIREETSWRLSRLEPLLGVHEWEADGLPRLEFDFLVEVEGDLEHPILEEGKVSDYRWLGTGDSGLLKENRSTDDLALYTLVRRALKI